ncbi:MAG: oatA [Frankiales bacterium]|nr:oatA [Frankiales bacterium]
MPSLTGLRGIAASAVFVNHIDYWLDGTPLAGRWAALTYVAICGVILFFVLSGFLLAQPQSMRGGKGSFWARRGARILPVYLLSLAVMWAFGMYHDPSASRLRPGNLIANLLLVQSWSSSGTGASINLPAWSLSVELLFYALLPLLIRPCTAAFNRWPGASLGVLLVMVQAGAMAVRWGGAKTFPPAYLPVFLLGVYAAARPAVARSARIYIPLAIGAVVISTPLHYFGLVAPAFAVLIGSLARHDTTGERSVLTGGTAQRLGVWSYAFFLFHVPVGFVLVSLISKPNDSTAGLSWSAIQFAASWTVAALIYRLVEEPARLTLSRPRGNASTTSGLPPVG